MTRITIETPSGPLNALSHDNDNLIHARGIPYATATRFSPPTPLTTFTTNNQPIDCTTPAPLCPQLPSRLSTVLGPLTTGHALSETCLHLSITAPKETKNAPVLVWLHGGAYISGGGDLSAYQPLDLARRGIVCATVTYRLGVFGYLALPGIAPANLGLLDQRAALEWIRDNIAAFGGDPRNVTMVGQSAGADSIICLLVSEGAEGLFHRAILLSPPLREIKERAESGTVELLTKQAESLIKADPREMGVSELLELQKKLLMDPVRGQIMLFAPALGSYPLPKVDEFERRVKERVSGIPILIGWTGHDGRPFASMLPGLWLKLLSVPILGSWLERLRTWWVTRSYFMWPSQWFHRLVLGAAGNSTTYSFEWAANGNGLGACHCIDIPFVLGSPEAWEEAPMLEGKGAMDEVKQLGEEVKELWVEFVKGRELKKDHISIRRGFTLSQEVFV